jgi:hypothetical protein
MKDAARIRIAAAVTTLFIGALAGTGVVLRNADNAAAPPSSGPSRAVATASAPAPTAAAASPPARPQVAVSRVSPAIGGSPGGAKPVVRRERHELERGGEATYD